MNTRTNIKNIARPSILKAPLISRQRMAQAAIITTQLSIAMLIHHPQSFSEANLVGRTAKVFHSLGLAMSCFEDF